MPPAMSPCVRSLPCRLKPPSSFACVDSGHRCGHGGFHGVPGRAGWKNIFRVLRQGVGRQMCSDAFAPSPLAAWVPRSFEADAGAPVGSESLVGGRFGTRGGHDGHSLVGRSWSRSRRTVVFAETQQNHAKRGERGGCCRQVCPVSASAGPRSLGRREAVLPARSSRAAPLRALLSLRLQIPSLCLHSTCLHSTPAVGRGL